MINPMYKGYCVRLKDGSFVDKDMLIYSVPIPEKTLVNDLKWVKKFIYQPALVSYSGMEPSLVEVKIGFTVSELPK